MNAVHNESPRAAPHKRRRSTVKHGPNPAENPVPPRVLCLSGHDPGGGAGIHADIEAVAAQGAHALTVITALTIQDSRNVHRVQALAPAWLEEQIAVLEADGPIAAVKIGLIGDAAQVPLLAATVARLRCPCVLDPVLRAGGGTELADAALRAALLDTLLAHVTVLTPNAAEARRLVPEADDLPAAAASLLARGCAHVLITGGDEPGEHVTNIGYAHGAAPRRFEWPRLPETFHGAGCTLAAALAARLALGEPVGLALERAQAWTQATLAGARHVGQGRRIPNRRLP